MLRKLFIVLIAAALLAACQNQQVAQEPTATLAPIVSLTPRFTATPVPSRTPTPTITPSPTETPIPPTPSDTPTPTEPPPVLGVIQSVQDVNIRSGPGTGFDAVTALRPGTGVEVLGASGDGAWFNILMDDGRQGWVSATLVFVRPSATPLPTLTPLPNLTALAANPLPTDIFGNTLTPTPPRVVVTPTLPGDAAALLNPTTTPVGGAGIPVIDIAAINQTATALAGGAGAGAVTPAGGPTGGPLPIATTGVPTVSGPAQTGTGIDVFALCDDPRFRLPVPNIAAGSTLDIYFAWFAATRQQVEDHVAQAVYEVRLNGAPVPVGAPQFIRPSAGGGFEAYWYLPTAPLAAGQYQITYRVTWRQQVFDGTESFGPGTSKPEERGTCTFTVR